ncbi:hypothetical protein EV361DRAFT_344966 [Lentinula raphanica]|nr:hypothetical protein EV361DRAFT_344966 [Lentinula raphanica]
MFSTPMALVHPSSEWVKHPVYYDETCNNPVIRAEKTLFKYCIAPLNNHSAFLKTIQADAFSVNGEPIFLPNVTAHDFENLMAWLWHERWQPFELPLEDLISLLRVGRYLIMPHLMRWALRRVNTHEPPLSSTQKLLLSHELPLYHSNWLRPSVGAIILISPETYRGLESELDLMHPTILLKIQFAREALQNERNIIAMTLLPENLPPSLGCSQHHHSSICYPVWNGIWWNKVGRGLLLPESQARINQISDIPKFVREKVQWEGLGIHAACIESFIQHFESAGIFAIESRIITAATAAISNFLRVKMHGTGLEFDFTVEDAADEERLKASGSV